MASPTIPYGASDHIAKLRKTSVGFNWETVALLFNYNSTSDTAYVRLHISQTWTLQTSEWLHEGSVGRMMDFLQPIFDYMTANNLEELAEDFTMVNLNGEDGLNGLNGEDGLNGGDVPQLDPGPVDDTPPLEGILTGEGLVRMSSIAVAAIALARTIQALIVRAFPNVTRGMTVRWASMPQWLRTALVAIGFTAGVDILLDWGEGDFGLIQIPGTTNGVGDPVGAMVAAMTVSTWNANGVQFHRLSDGRLAVRNKHGVWKVWRPKKPIVLFTTGNRDLQDVIRADRVIQKEGKKIARMLRNRGFHVARKPHSS